MIFKVIGGISVAFILFLTTANLVTKFQSGVAFDSADYIACLLLVLIVNKFGANTRGKTVTG